MSPKSTDSYDDWLAQELARQMSRRTWGNPERLRVWTRRELGQGDAISLKKNGEGVRADFEQWIIREFGADHSQPWGIVERSTSGGGRTGLPEVINDGYLDLYTQRRWEGWKAAYGRDNGGTMSR